jgi:hypothetical protein
MSNLPPRRKRVSSIMPPDMLDDDDDDYPSIHPIPILDAEATSQLQNTALPSVPDAQSSRQAPMARPAPMTESQVRLEMGKMSRDQLENAFIQLSQSHQPSNESVASLLRGDDLLLENTPITKRVETFIDQVSRFQTHCRSSSRICIMS